VSLSVCVALFSIHRYYIKNQIEKLSIHFLCTILAQACIHNIYWSIVPEVNCD